MKKINFILSAIMLICIGAQFLPVEYHCAITDYILGGGVSYATIYIPGCGVPPPPTCQDCPTKELGGIRGIAVIPQSYTWTNITNPAEWDALICNEGVFVFPFTNGTFTSDANTSDGYGNLPTTLDSYTMTLDIHEPQYQNNVPFWNFIKKGISYSVIYKTETMFHQSAVSAQFTPSAPVGKDVKSKIDMGVKIMWVQENLIQPISCGAAASIFQTCTDC